MLALLLLATLLPRGGGDARKGTGDKSATTTSTKGGDGEATSQEKPIVVTSAKLGSDLRANALKAAETYKGKRVTVTGPVSSIDASGDYFNLQGADEFDLAGVRIDIDDSQKGIVSKFSPRQKVTVTGEVTDVGEVMGYMIKAESIE
ncbi:OB-fold protein [Mobilicoccus pelagius]|uniref:OB-fold protein n=1 Tax=Mobilicoccus pelagius TaxID=746032 RepID=UPI002479D0E7|nr:hypothetical protein [Mobilicoccus pelagius]